MARGLLPRFVPVTTPAVTGPCVTDAEQTIREVTVWLTDSSPLLRPGKRTRSVAITAGSRSFAGFVPILRQLVGLLRTRGFEPFLIPAMGSHGGGTTKGQLEVLLHQGVTPATVRAAIRCRVPSRPATRPVSICGPDGSRRTPVYCHPAALNSDAVIVLNRVQIHTGFDGEIQSGLLKMLAIGLGGPEGAAATHALGAAGLEASILEISRALAYRLPIAAALATVQDTQKGLVALKAAVPEAGERTGCGWGALRRTEAWCLALARRLEPRLPVDELDLLVVDWMGKDVSGAGMHPQVVGRRRVWDYHEPDRPRIRRVVVLRLTPASAGNANGIGLADFTTRRLAETIDWSRTLKNVLTSTFTQRANLPPSLPSDREALEAALLTLGPTDPGTLRAIRLRDTAHLGEFWVSESVLAEILEQGGEVAGPAAHLPFGPDGNLADIGAQ